jgi:Ser/Thr protein kinase RdoA (MazF antagonist)
VPSRLPALLLLPPHLNSLSMTHTPLEPDLAALIEPRTGPILDAARTPRGYTSDYTGIIRAASGRLFVKAVRDPGRLVSSLEREAAINPAVRHLSPPLRWQARGHGWYALGFQHAPGTHASLAPGSPDLPAVIRAIGRTAGLLAGDTLLHGDINPDNLLIGPDGNATIVDWSWPTHGAAFIDPACLVLQLIAAGHTPAHAEKWAAHCTAWRDADPAAISAFAAAALRMYQRFEQLDPQPWRKAMTTAAAAWTQHRAQTPAAPRTAPANANSRQ